MVTLLGQIALIITAGLILTSYKIIIMSMTREQLLAIDFAILMDLRVDFAFKLLFGGKDTRHLISLLNAIFANKGIQRRVDSLTIMNPMLEKKKKRDKLAILDIRAKLSDQTIVLIEMHLYNLGEFKYKTIRSWARAFSEELKAGEGYSLQPSVIGSHLLTMRLSIHYKPIIHAIKTIKYTLYMRYVNVMTTPF